MIKGKTLLHQYKWYALVLSKCFGIEIYADHFKSRSAAYRYSVKKLRRMK